MKKDKLRVIILTSVSLAILVSCGSPKQENRSAIEKYFAQYEKSDTEKADVSENELKKEAENAYLSFMENREYEKYLANWIYGEPQMYSILDINQDNCAELLISGGDEFGFYNFLIFSYDKETKNVYPMYAKEGVLQYYGELEYSGKHKALVFTSANNPAYHDDFEFWQIDEKQLYSAFVLTYDADPINSTVAMDSVNYKITKGGASITEEYSERITEKEWEEYFSDIQSIEWTEIENRDSQSSNILENDIEVPESERRPIDLTAEIAHIRETYAYTNEHLAEYEKTTVNKNTETWDYEYDNIYYYDGNVQVKQIVEDEGTRVEIYGKNPALVEDALPTQETWPEAMAEFIFATVNGAEYRIYMKDSLVIRYIGPDHVNVDYEQPIDLNELINESEKLSGGDSVTSIINLAFPGWWIAFEGDWS